MPLELRNRRGRRIASGVADAQGSLMFREIPPGDGYVVRAKPPLHEAVGPLTVMSIEGSTPPPEFYRSQHLEPGFGYIETRDGTRLSVFVSLPGPVEDGPYPTLVNYSGYDPSEPGKPLDFPGIDISFLCGDLPVLCDAPNHPSGLIAGVLGFATVGVNLRGTGCSGGAYDFFEPLQLLDGYDVIETVAAQDWALNHRVGMAGLSYPGITQLFVASTRPPSLAAITPLSVIDATPSVLAPGGILNDGFALEWGQEVLERAAPYGRGWEQGVVDAGDTTCEENQLLHSQKVDIIEKALSYPFYVPEIYDPVDPITLVDRIDVPVFTAGAWQDEQVGGHFPALWNRFTNAPVVRFTGYNGAHADGYTPQILAEWKNFLDFYVAGEIRPISPLVRSISPFLFESVFGAFVQIPEERFADFPSFDAARTTYEAEPPVRIILESGGSPDEEPGAPVGGFELSFPSWPPPNTEPRRWYFHADGSLRDFPPAEPVAASTFQADPEKGQETYEVHDAFEQALPDIEWLPWKPGRQVVFVSEPLLEDVVMVGHASADLWIQATADDADLEVMLSEVRPDGMETYVQSGWLRASQRALSPESTPLRPIQTHREADAAPLPPGEWTSARVEIYPFAHVFRAGSRLRVSVSTPGGNQGRWRYDVLPTHATVAVSHSAAHPSSVLLPVIPDVEVPTPLPPCPSLRSQPCREYVPQLNARLE
jgi:predicted acyl esterase